LAAYLNPVAEVGSSLSVQQVIQSENNSKKSSGSLASLPFVAVNQRIGVVKFLLNVVISAFVKRRKKKSSAKTRRRVTLHYMNYISRMQSVSGVTQSAL
jgi:hypothetical protein